MKESKVKEVKEVVQFVAFGIFFLLFVISLWNCGEGWVGEEGKTPAAKTGTCTAEVCDGIDNNCDGKVDEDGVCQSSFCDSDGDGWCPPVDCNDNNLSVYPGATEICGDGIDNNCDEKIDEICDSDGDGYTVAQGDCRDNDVNVHPGATENCGTAYDDDCDGSINENCPNEDVDGDGYTVAQGDCNDLNSTIHPGATEICNSIDDNCAGGIDEGCPADADGDGYTVAQGDCDDSRANVYPSAPELCDGLNNDCDGQVDESCSSTDADGDGYIACTGTITGSCDCNDSNNAIKPGAAEICTDLIDNDCDGIVNEGCTTTTDADGDGYTACTGTVTGSCDCNDSNSAIKPGAAEICGDSIDNDCDNLINEGCTTTTDADGDGYTACSGTVTGSCDCNDSNSAIRPGVAEVCGDSIDNDCDGIVNEGCTTSDADGDGYTASNDCNDNNKYIHPGASEKCDNFDNDCNGIIDDGSVCITDIDNDGEIANDLCAFVPDASNTDSNGNGIGDVCEVDVVTAVCTEKVGVSLNWTNAQFYYTPPWVASSVTQVTTTGGMGGRWSGTVATAGNFDFNLYLSSEPVYQQWWYRLGGDNNGICRVWQEGIEKTVTQVSNTSGTGMNGRAVLQ